MPTTVQPLAILHAHPFFWPEVRRGAEREIHDLAQAQARAGHRVRLVTSSPDGLVRRWAEGDLAVTAVRRPDLRRLGWTPEASSLFGTTVATAGARADVVHAWHHVDAFALSVNRRLRRRAPLVLKLTGTVEAARMEHVRFERRFFREAIRAADEVWVNSSYARDAMAGFGVPMHVVPAGIDLGRFTPGGARSAKPTVLCTAAPDEPRKRVALLVHAWPAVRAAIPDASLVLAGRADDDVQRRLLEGVADEVAESIRFVGSLEDEELVESYRSAWVTVAPAVAEALGLATLESLACGTPVAGARSGATVELVTSGAGTLYDPDDTEACAAAIVDLLTATPDPVRCRAAAEPFGWTAVAPLVEARYRNLLGG